MLCLTYYGPTRKHRSLSYFLQAGQCHFPCSLTVFLTSVFEEVVTCRLSKGIAVQVFQLIVDTMVSPFRGDSHSSLSQGIMSRFDTAIWIGLGTRILSIQETACLAVCPFCCPESIQGVYILNSSISSTAWTVMLWSEHWRLVFPFPPHSLPSFESSCDIKVKFELIWS